MHKRNQFTSTKARFALNRCRADRYVNGARLVWPKLDFHRAKLVALGVTSPEADLPGGTTLQICCNPHKLLRSVTTGKR